MQSEYLFVYGTLRREGGSRWHDFLAQHCQFVDLAYFQGRLYMLQGYPGLVSSPHPRERVVGELYRLPVSEGVGAVERLLSALDDYEECSEKFPRPHEYLREVHPVSTKQKTQLKAWVYIYNRTTDESVRIVSGDFLDR